MPSYMLDLYQRYTSGLPPPEGSNTVHCILATRERAADKEAIVFSLDTVTRDETTLKAELRFHRRATFVRDAERTLLVSLRSIRSRDIGGGSGGESPTWTATLSAASPPLHGGGDWQTMDVTQPIKRALSSTADGIELVLTFANASGAEAAAASGSDAAALGLFLRHHSLPYVLIYANDTVNLTADQISSRLRLRDGLSMRQEAESLIDPETGLSGGVDDWGGASAQRLPPPSSREFRARKLTRRLPARVTRDVLDNEIPGDPDVARRLQQHGRPPRRQRPAAAAARGVARGRPPVAGLEILRPRQERMRGGRAGVQLIPWPLVGEPLRSSEQRLRGGGGGGPARTDGGGKTRPRTAPSQQPQPRQSNRAPGSSSCGRKRLTLDFDDVGWGGWIIEPKAFEIHYCSGTCEFPLSSAQQPTNHATIQSLLRAAGVRPDLPSPCCVPDKLSSVTLLYYDQKRNVVLKNYPGMTVESCACR